MKLYLLPIFIGASIMIVGHLSLYGKIEISSTYIACVSISGWFFAVADLSEGFVDLFKGDLEKNKILNVISNFTMNCFNFSVYPLYFIAIFSLIGLPTMLEKFPLGENLIVSSESLAVGTIGMVVLAIVMSEMRRLKKESEIIRLKREIERLKQLSK